MTYLNGQTPDIVEENIQKLRSIFPDVFTEGKIDYEKLQLVLGNYIETESERYNFSWNGKARALRLAQTPSTGTLRPCKEESKDWETTENLYIEGDNLEALKLLQKSYHNKIKMIYIDPPYNTGNDFVYPDDYKDSIENYLIITGQVDEDGKKTGTNSEASGRYHTDWLNMMYPRLRLARNLLSENGVIFISIDDNEVDNLKKICNEILGEENFVAEFVWRRTDNQPNIGNIARVKEYILCYCKNSEHFNFGKLSLTEKAKNEYRYEDENGKFRRAILLDKTRGRHFYNVITKSGNILNGPWMLKEDDFKNLDKENGIYWTSGGDEQPYGKIYLHESQGQIPNDFLGIEFGTNQRASLEVEKLFGKRLFDFPKPVSLIKTFITIGSKHNEIILDFFSGSATTAHAVMQLNAEDGGNRKFIMVQLPEPIDENSEAGKAGYKNICEIGKERIRRAGEKIKSETADAERQIQLGEEDKQPLDIGFKVLKLDSSNIRKWNPDYASENIDEYFQDAINNYVDGRTELDVVYEIIIKYGLSLSYSIEELNMNGKKIYSVASGMLMICLDNDLTTDIASYIVKFKKNNQVADMRVVFKDNGFKYDSNKTNIKEILKCGEIEEFITI